MITQVKWVRVIESLYCIDFYLGCKFKEQEVIAFYVIFRSGHIPTK
jgi:hypothetical protein